MGRLPEIPFTLIFPYALSLSLCMENMNLSLGGKEEERERC